ncbi:LysR substrate-binding domain-containing protein [Pseudaminobacter sp. NGMCC 1.201702]|jgi:DNA-binding transcriptional LysR family regulator|uniref:LysR substrate-binding domain-containing protein n=1 Tax=Pseudaminobacter sp. NGMCC 1.201702 TaxID=3391825 RepID=UPI0039EE97A4
MSGYRRQLPSMTSLVVFEAAARQKSFTKAAAELGITQAAVSRQVQGLEENLGFQLFRRLHRSIELTARGLSLSKSMSEALGIIAQTVQSITDESKPAELVISASVAFSHFWLLPNISDFRRANPDVKLKIVTQDSAVNLLREDIDVAIRYGNGNWPDGKAIMLFNDDIFPVCSPGYLAEHGAPDCVADLARHNLIASDSLDSSWTGWEQWLSAFGHSSDPRNVTLSCNFYTDAIYAALRGEGIALGWHRLVSDLLRQKQLIRVSSESVRTRHAYFVVLKAAPARKPAVESFLAWICSETNGSTATLQNSPF